MPRAPALLLSSLLACTPAPAPDVETGISALRGGSSGRKAEGDRSKGRSDDHDDDDHDQVRDRDDHGRDRDEHRAERDPNHDRDGHDCHHAAPSGTCPTAGSGAAGVSAYAAATCASDAEVTPSALTCNGEFALTVSLTPGPTQLTATVEVCKHGTSPAVKDLSHADLDLSGLLGCQTPGTALTDLLLGCRVLVGGGTCTLATPDPTTGVTGVKLDGVSAGDGCAVFAVDLSLAHTQPGFTLGAGPVLVATKAGPEDIRRRDRATPGYACLVGPACVPSTTNHPPTLVEGGPYVVREGDVLTLTATATDPDGDVLTYAWDLDGDGAFDDATGPTPSHAFLVEGVHAVSVRVSDGRGGEATADTTVTVTNAPPIAADDFATTLEDAVALVDLLANDHDPSPADVLTIVSVTQPEGGLATLLPSGQVEVRLEPDAAGLAVFTYTVSDGTDLATAHVEVTFLPTPDPVVAEDRTRTLDEDTVLTVPAEAGLRTQLVDPDGDPVTFALLSAPAHGTLALDFATGAYAYSPPADFHGVDAFQVTGTSGASTATATVHLVVRPVNDPPRAAPDAYATDEDAPLVVEAASGLLGNDLDPDGEALVVVPLSPPDFAQLFLLPDGSFTLVPDPDFYGLLTFEYVLSDGLALSEPALVTVVVRPVNDPPVATPERFVLTEDAPLTVLGNVLQGDHDPDGDLLTAALDGPAPPGVFTLGLDGELTYAPPPDFAGVFTFRYLASDGSAATPAEVILEVTPVDDAPTAPDQRYATDVATPLTVAAPGLLAGAADPDGDSLVVFLETAPSLGDLTLGPDGGFTYSPRGTPGVDVFTFAVSDGRFVAFATATVDVAPNPRPPVFTTAPVLAAALGDPYTYDADATDPDLGDVLTFGVDFGPPGLTIDPASGVVSWLPTSTVGSPFPVTLRATDATGRFATQTYALAVEVLPNRPPRIVSDPARHFILDPTVGPEVPADLSAFTVVDLVEGTQAPARWEIQPDPTVVIQRVNARASVFLSDFDARVSHVAGTFEVRSTGDDDFVGFVFGWQDDGHFYLFDWKRGTQSGALRGMNVKRVDTDARPRGLWETYGNEPDVVTLYHNSVPWVAFHSYRFELTYQPGEFVIVVREGTAVLATIHLFDDRYPNGRFGFFNYSQDAVLYRGFTRSALAARRYAYDVLAVDPDEDPLTYALLAGPPGATFAGAELRWDLTSADVGTHPFSVEVSDGRGGTDRQDFEVTVVDDAPVIATTPPTLTVAGRPYAYAAASLDRTPGDVLTYRLLNAPSGMAVDPSLGLVTWVSTATQTGLHAVELEVTDAAGLTHTQRFALEVLENHPPVFTSTPTLTAKEGALYLSPLAAADPDPDESFTFSVVAGPAGLEAHGPTLTFTPTGDQVGPHPVTLEVRDLSGAAATLDFVLTVENVNSPPVILSSPPARALVGAAFEYAVLAVDPDPGPDQLTYALAWATPGFALQQGVLRGTFSTPGTGSFSIVVFDERGAQARQSFTVEALGPESAPTFASAPVPGVTAGTPWHYAPAVTDPLGGALTYTLAAAPAGVGFDPATGALTWTPGESDVGTHPFALTVHSTSGFSATQGFTLTVLSPARPPPLVLSAPPPNATAGALFAYRAVVVSAAPPLTYALATAPAGMSVDATGLLSWLPGPADAGTHAVDLVVTDLGGAVVHQVFTLRVLLDPPNRPPVFASTPEFGATVGVLYTYGIEVTDPDVGDLVSLSLLAGPPGLELLSDALSFTPTPADVGPHPVELLAVDRSGEAVVQAYTLEVRATNTPPVIASTPPTTATEDVPLHYALAVSDPDPDPDELHRFALLASPPGATLDGLGVLSFTPGDADAGQTLGFSVRVTDRGGATDTQSFSIFVTPVPDAPTAGAFTPPLVTAGVPLSLDLAPSVADADGEPLEFSLALGPTGLTLSPAGLLAWTPGATQLGPHPVEVTATDPSGRAATLAFVLTVEPDPLPPVVTLTLDPPGPLDLGDVLTVLVTATDDAAPPALTLSLDGAPLGVSCLPAGLGTTCTATVSLTTAGARTLSVTTADAGGNVVTETRTLRVLDPSDTTPPVLSLLQPADDAVLVGPTDVTVDVADAHLLEVELQLASRTDLVFTSLGKVPAPGPGGVVGQVDPTLLENGLYVLRVVATDVNGLTTAREISLEVDGGAKVGIFTLSFQDLVVPMAGIPITVTRTYDSRVKTRRDFGVGWSLDVATGRFTTNRPLGDGWVLRKKVGFGQPPCGEVLEPKRHKLEVRLSDREVYRFAARVVNTDGGLGFCEGDVELVETDSPRPGATLVILGNSHIWQQQNFDVLRDSVTYDLFEPKAVRLTTPEGMVYDVDRVKGVTRIEDRNGNVITVGKTGLVHSAGQSVVFTRDAQGRITKITDPLGQALRYEYDAQGDLVRFVDAAGAATRFTYLARPAHHLDEVINALGVRAAKNEYDGSGRLVASIDPAGNRIEFEHDLEGRREVTRNRLGHPIELLYDERGNVLRETRYVTIDGVLTPVETTRTFDARDNETSATNALGQVERTSYDARGNVSRETQLGGAVFEFRHNTQNQLLTLSDALGHTSTRTYDAKGNLTGLATPDGTTSAFAVDARGLITRSTDSDGVVSTYTYSRHGRPLSISDSIGNVTTYDYDASGRNTGERLTYLVDGVSRTRETRRVYDAVGRITAETNALGETRRFEYDALGRLRRTIEPSGRAHETIFDDLGRAIREIDPSGVAQARSYDAEGRLIRTQDAEGRFVEWDLDERGLPVEVRSGGPGAVTRVERRRYDILGRLLEVARADGSGSRFEYDDANRPILERNRLGEETRTEYDVLGRTIAIVDALGRRETRRLDTGGRPIETRTPDGVVWRTVYDTQGRPTLQVTPEGRTRRNEYGPTGHLAKKVDGEGNVTEYLRDSQGALIGVRDAEGRVRRYERDLLGRRVKTTLPGGQVALRAFDADGQLEQLVAFDGQVSHFEHDPAGRVARKVLGDSSERRFLYSLAGRLLSVSDSGGSRSWTYDGEGRMTSRTESFGRVRYEHDALGRVAAVESPHERTVYRRDLAGRVDQVTTSAGIFRLARDELGRLTEIAYPNGLREVRRYALVGPIERVELWAGTATLAAYRYEYDRDGLRVLAVERDRTIRYAYDRAQRLIEETVTTSSSVGVRRFAFDGVGNRVSEIDDGVRLEYEYDADDRLLRVVSPRATKTYGWDANGNLRSIVGPDRVATLSYSPEDQLAAATIVSSGAQVDLRYAYDHRGMRIGKRLGSTAQHYLIGDHLAHAQVLESLGAGGEQLAAHTWVEEGLLASRGPSWRFVHHDARGDVRAESDAIGLVTSETAFSAFGASAGSPSGEDFYGMASEAFDRDLGLYYLRARYMDPGVGQFTTRDPIDEQVGALKGTSTYVYASGDPVNRRDPSGLFTTMETSVTQNARSDLQASAATGSNALFIANIGGLAIATALLADARGALQRDIDEAEACLRSRSKKCRIKFPLFLPGLDTQRTTEHIADAIEGRGDTWPRVMENEAAAPLSPLLVRGPRDPVKYDGEVQCDPTMRSYYHATFDVESSVCDEYPFASSLQGGDLNYQAGLVSIRLTPRWEGSMQGGFLAGFYRKCRLPPAGVLGGRVFGVIPGANRDTDSKCGGR